MEQIRIRGCTLDDIDGVIALEQQWQQEDIAYGNFNPMSRAAYAVVLARLPAFFLVAEHERQLVAYIHASVRRDNPVEVIPADQPYVAAARPFAPAGGCSTSASASAPTPTCRRPSTTPVRPR